MTFPSIAALQKELYQCQHCRDAGHPIQSGSVYSGQQSARLMLIGQAPGVTEVDERKPFAGDAGVRLFRWLERAGWSETEFRKTCYITSVTKCFPGSNPKGAGDRVPSAAERKLCRPWLDEELRLVDPAVIVPVGRLAIDIFFPEKPNLTDVIGDSYQDSSGRHLLPLPHPSGASRWFNDPTNVGRLDLAIYRLRTLKAELEL